MQLTEPFVMALSTSACGETARRILALPPNLGGLGIFDPSAAAERQFATSNKITAPLVDLIVSQDPPIQLIPLLFDRSKQLQSGNITSHASVRPTPLRPFCHQIKSEQWSLPKRKEPLHGSQPCLWKSMVLPFIRVAFGMLSAFVTFGICRGHQSIVHAARSLVSIMQCAVLKGVFRLYATMKFGT